ncbi:lysosome-associated membrane glycoprotein 1-like [Aricia agestis]|uniref:lysosome-associated membrane glycoprotein 1-like n=1 Tax=Aricia agestis TaxID=91739 RepID=UPI001C209EE1|nr:lysosome-associated membrane glycoprotein 1-like [Aricia agestis]
MFRLSFCLLSLVFSSLLGQGAATENAPAAPNSQPPVLLSLKPENGLVKPEVLLAPERETLKEKPAILQASKAGPTTVQPAAPTELSTETEPTTSKPTEAPTTSKPTEAPTTDPPTPPPTPKPTPPPAPKPVPAPQQGKWFYAEANVTCIIVQFAAQLNVTYNNTSSALSYALLNVPANATVAGGSCNGTEQWLKLSWPTTSGNGTHNMTLCFNTTGDDYQLHSLNVSIAAEDLPNAQDNTTLELWHGAGWRTALRTSYRCAAPAPLNLTAAPGHNAAARLALAQLQDEAFRTAATNQFSSPRECDGGDVTDAVPIAVGCALAGLVAVMLAAYLIGRRRSAAHGYLSM